jgi:hypothetical protein
MDFFKEYSDNITYVITVALVLFGIIILLHLYNINLNTISDKKLLQVVTIEGYNAFPSANKKTKEAKKCRYVCYSKQQKYDKGKGGGRNNELRNPKEDIPPKPLLLRIGDFLSSDLERDFCKSFLGSSDKLQTQCNQLTKDNCKNSPCCVFVDGRKCVAGDAKGPTFQTTPNGSKINMDYYYYQNKCYGNCPKKSLDILLQHKRNKK